MEGALWLLLVFLGGIALAFVGLLPIAYAHIGLVELMKKIGAKLVELSYKHSWLAWLHDRTTIQVAGWISFTISCAIPMALMYCAGVYGPGLEVSYFYNALRGLYAPAMIYIAGAWIWISGGMLFGSSDTMNSELAPQPCKAPRSFSYRPNSQTRRAAPSQGQP